MIFDPRIPFALWWPLALASAGLLGWYAVAARQRLARRRWIVVGLMAVAAAIPLAILLNPTWLERIPPPEGKPLLTVLVDASASMTTADAPEGASRYRHASRLAADVARDLADRYEVRIRTFAERWSAASADDLARRQPDGPATDVAAALADSLDAARVQGQAILLLSDGIHNATGSTAPVLEAATQAKAIAAPIYAHTLGGPSQVNDLEVTVGLAQEVAFVGQRVPVTVTLRQRGKLATTTKLTLSGDHGVIETRDVSLPADGETEETFYVGRQGHGGATAPGKIQGDIASSAPTTDGEAEPCGLYRYEFHAEPLAGEVTPLNNSATLLVRVLDQPVRVLLLEGKPYWDTKFLVRMLAADPSVELVSVVKMAEGRLLQRTISRPAALSAAESKPAPTAPEPPAERAADWTILKSAAGILADAQTLAGYQVVILGRDAEAFLSDEALVQLKKWLVAGSGSLVCYRGPPAAQLSQRLGDLLPVRWAPAAESRFRVQLTGAGRALRWLPATRDADGLAGLPSLAAVHRVEGTKPLATVLATTAGGTGGPPEPVITYQPLGNGRVVVVDGAGMWRWAFLPPEHQKSDELYGLFWRSLTRWLVSNVGLLPGQEVALRTDKVTFSTDETATATLLTRAARGEAETPAVELTGPGQDAPRKFAAVPVGGEVGQFQVRLGRLPEGAYTARVVGAGQDEVLATASFDVRGNPLERLEVAARPDLMQQIAQRSGGELLTHFDTRRIAAQLEEHLRRSQPERIVQNTAWDRWWWLLGAFGLWAATWGLRRRSGLV